MKNQKVYLDFETGGLDGKPQVAIKAYVDGQEVAPKEPSTEKQSGKGKLSIWKAPDGKHTLKVLPLNPLSGDVEEKKFWFPSSALEKIKRDARIDIVKSAIRTSTLQRTLDKEAYPNQIYNAFIEAFPMGEHLWSKLYHSYNSDVAKWLRSLDSGNEEIFFTSPVFEFLN